MKHTDFYKIFKAVRDHIIDELVVALDAHGGEYSWRKDCPIVAANPDTCEPEPLDICIHSLKLDKDNNIIINATEKLTDEPVQHLTIQDIFIEHLPCIIDDIKSTSSVVDVSIPFTKLNNNHEIN